MDPTRRVALICSHLRPVAASVPTLTRSSTSNSPPRSSSDVSKDSNSSTDCVFCRVINGDSPAFKLYEDDQCLCILDSNPLAPGHCLIIPKFHYSSLEATPPSVVAAMCSKVPFIGSAIMRATACDSFNLLVNNGAAAGQVIFHTHIHIIPRKKSDCLWTSESLCRRPMFGTEASQLAERVREEMTGSNYVSEEGKVQESSTLS